MMFNDVALAWPPKKSVCSIVFLYPGDTLIMHDILGSKVNMFLTDNLFQTTVLVESKNEHFNKTQSQYY